MYSYIHTYIHINVYVNIYIYLYIQHTYNSCPQDASFAQGIIMSSPQTTTNYGFL